jgi:hypothetical protein
MIILSAYVDTQLYFESKIKFWVTITKFILVNLL